MAKRYNFLFLFTLFTSFYTSTRSYGDINLLNSHTDIHKFCQEYCEDQLQQSEFSQEDLAKCIASCKDVACQQCQPSFNLLIFFKICPSASQQPISSTSKCIGSPVEPHTKELKICIEDKIGDKCRTCTCPCMKNRFKNAGESQCCAFVPTLVMLQIGGESQSEELGNTFIEAFYEDGTHLCQMDDLPDRRRYHTSDGEILCGGKDNKSSKSCLYYDEGKWVPYPWVLQNERYKHVSWRRPNGQTFLMGGEASPVTTEVVSESGSTESFLLKYKTKDACSIQFEDFVVITGGFSTKTIVSRYDENGWVMDLPGLNSGRHSHGCGHFYNNDNNMVYLVVGGNDGKDDLKTTETFEEGAIAWKFVKDIPSGGMGISGISLNNRIFMFGGFNNGNLSSGIYEYENNQWISKGDSANPIAYHSISIVPLNRIEPYCRSESNI